MLITISAFFYFYLLICTKFIFYNIIKTPCTQTISHIIIVRKLEQQINVAPWTSSPTKQMSDREIVEAMNALLQDNENIKALKEEQLYIEKKLDKTMFKMEKLWGKQ